MELVQEVDPQSASTTLTYDAFGRPIELRAPDPATGLPSVEASLRIVYFTAPGGPVQRRRTDMRTAPGVWRQSWGYTDGLGSPLLSLEQADPAAGDAGSWLGSGLSRRDGQGFISGDFDPWFYNGDPAAHPLAYPTTPETLFYRDHFGRLTLVKRPGGALVTRYRYGTLSAAAIDEDGRLTEVTTDGHGRPIILQRADSDGLINSHVFFRYWVNPRC